MPGGPWPLLLAVSFAGWAALLANDAWLFLPAYCANSAFVLQNGWAAFDAALRINPPAATAFGWAIMLAAMMPPLLATALTFVWGRSLARRRVRSVALFLIGYGALWIAAGALLVPLAIAGHALAGLTGIPALLLVLPLFLAWQASPAKQTCLNGCHRRLPLRAFGRAADADAFRFGLSQGAWCAGACWALMLLPLMVGAGHGGAMGLAALFAFAERQEKSRPARWSLRWPRTGLAASWSPVRRLAVRARA